MLVDADRRAQERLKRLRELRERFHGKGVRFHVPVALGVAVETIEAWLLADEDALARVLGVRQRPEHIGSPEDLRGARGGADDPKARLNSWLRHDTQSPRSFLQQVNALIREIDLDVVAQRCPRGFAPFREDVLRNLGPLFTSPTGSSCE